MTELQAVGAYLAARKALIVLDNCEHLVNACAEAAEAILDAAPEVVVLTTSRARMGLGGEAEWRVPSLTLPSLEDEGAAKDEIGSANGNGASDAVALFMERAVTARPDLTLRAGDAASVAAICTELDGLPLAIELAAARVRILSLDQIAAGLSDRFRLLSGGPRTASDRLKTIRASVDWSHELLSDPERALLRRLSVFAGGSTLEAVDEVCAGDGIDREAVLDLLASLVDQSLVIAETTEAGVRYRLLETVRQYGLERLAEAGEEEKIRARQRDHFLALAEEAAPQLETGGQREWLDLLDREANNLAAAIDHALNTEPPRALRFCVALCRWWEDRGRFAEAELADSRALEAVGDREPALRALVFYGRAYLAFPAGDYEAAEARASEALALASEVGDEGTAARARCQLGTAVLPTDPRAARAEATRAAELAEAAGDDWALVQASQLTAWSYFSQAKHDLAARAFDEVAALEERIGDPNQAMFHWLFVGFIAVWDGRVAEARDASDRTRVVVEGIGESFREAYVASITALVEIWEGVPERAIERLLVRLEGALRLGAGAVVPLLLIGIAHGELAAGRPEQARDRLEGLVALLEGRDAFTTAWALVFLSDARRLLGEEATEAAALEAQALGERLETRLVVGQARLGSVGSPQRAASGRPHARTRSPPSMPARRAATWPTSPRVSTPSRRLRRGSARTRTRCGSSPRPRARAPRSASCGCRPRRSTGRRSSGGCATRSAPTATRRRGLRARG
jgi:predicted ATPase